ncbi:2Fe-2S iron-sulfur cluster-binding protein, partial [Thermodesulfobacteriota bacterium]
MDDTVSFLIEFQPLGLRDKFSAEQSLLECARQLGIDLISLCGGTGSCGKCKIQIIAGDVSGPLEEEEEILSFEEISKGYRLACRAYAKSDLLINIPAESLSAPQRLQVEGLEIPFTPDPAIQTHDVSMQAPSLSDLRGDDERLLEAIESQHGILCKDIDKEVLRSLSPFLRSLNWKASATVRDTEIISLGPCGGHGLGMAVDLGTTKIAGYLVDLETGFTISAKGIANPQISYGEDVITRISRAQASPGDALTLQQKVIDTINMLSKELCQDTANTRPEEIKEIVVAGNTAMHHLLLGLPVEQLARAPHVPAVGQSVNIKARDLGLAIARGWNSIRKDTVSS